MSSSSITARWFLTALATAVCLLSVLTNANAQPTLVRIGALVPAKIISPEEGLQQALSEMGYIEGKNLTIVRRRADSNDAWKSGAEDLVQSRVDVIVAFGTSAARAALSATSTIPVVFISGDPVGTGLAASLARPGANGTGISTLSSELVPKRLELLQQIAPRVRRVILLGNPSGTLHAGILKEAQRAAQMLRIQIIALDARNEKELNAALRGVRRTAADAFITSPDVLFLSNKEKIAAAVAKAKLPAIFPVRDYHDAGVLMSYGASTREAGRQAATYVHKILKGAKPAELPIEQISKYELVIDLRVAHELGLDVPQDLLLRADKVIR